MFTQGFYFLRGQGAHPATLRGNPLQLEARVAFKEAMVQKLAARPWIADSRQSYSVLSFRARLFTLIFS